LIRRARAEAGLSQAALALLSDTSRPTLSAYERGRKSPTLATAARIVAAAMCEFAIVPRIEFHGTGFTRGRPIRVPSALPRLSLDRAFAVIELPLHLNWSDRGRRYDLSDRRHRARVYEIVLREGRPDDVLAYIDGALLLDLWDELVLPRDIRAAWEALTGRPVGAVGAGVA
jgi:transcriptional regulator with XRE-family HTH domain